MKLDLKFQAICRHVFQVDRRPKCARQLLEDNVGDDLCDLIVGTYFFKKKQKYQLKKFWFQCNLELSFIKTPPKECENTSLWLREDI